MGVPRVSICPPQRPLPLSASRQSASCASLTLFCPPSRPVIHQTHLLSTCCTPDTADETIGPVPGELVGRRQTILENHTDMLVPQFNNCL